MMRSKIVVVFVALLAMFGLQLTTPASPANAWTGALGQCGAFPYAWQSAIQADSRYNSDTAWVAYQRYSSGGPFDGQRGLAVVWSPTSNWLGQIVFTGSESGGTASLDTPAVASYYKVLSTGLVDVSAGASNWSTTDVACVLDVHNVTYGYYWSGSTYPDSVAANQGSLEYVAMGDSYSSGEGAPPFLYGTAETTNKCHRSENAYSMLLDKTPSLDLKLMDFVACSGATTDTVLNGGSGDGAWGEAAQVDALSSSTDVVTLTIGGNDVGFKDYATACEASGFCEEGTSAYEDIMDAIDGDLTWKLETTYQEILDQANNATVYVTGYPYLVDPSSGCVSFGWTDDLGVMDVIDHLNDTIEDAVNDVESSLAEPSNAGRIEYVEPNAVGNPFEDHYLCSSVPYFIPAIYTPDPNYSFHPNTLGQDAYKALFADALS